MTNFGKGKRLITTLISVLLCILTAFSVLGVNLKLKNNQEKETTQKTNTAAESESQCHCGTGRPSDSERRRICTGTHQRIGFCSLLSLSADFRHQAQPAGHRLWIYPNCREQGRRFL